MLGGVATVKVATPSASLYGDSRKAVAGSEFNERLRRLRQKKIFQWKQRGGGTPTGFAKIIGCWHFHCNNNLMYTCPIP